MDAIGYRSPSHHRVLCHIHALTRAEERGVALDAADMAALAAAIESLRAAWIVPSRERYWLNVRHRDVRCRVLYDARLRCIVTVVRDRRVR